MASEPQKIDRRKLLADGVRVVGAMGLVGAAGFVAGREGWENDFVWQIDPDLCMACGNCETHCVLDVSAAKAVQFPKMCGYCDICTGYFPTKDYELDTGAENQLCPTGAVIRHFIENQSGTRFFDYAIDEELCIGCAKCVEGCALMNGSLYMQIRHEWEIRKGKRYRRRGGCVNCNECSIAVACPTQAIRRVPADDPNLFKKLAREMLDNEDTSDA